jgi:hypothetical protein
MAKDGFAPEIKSAMGTSKPGRINTSPRKESPADISRDKKAGIKEGSARDNALDAQPQNMQQPGKPQPLNTVQHAQLPRAPGQVLGPDTPHIAAATSIAHAILARRGGQ